MGKSCGYLFSYWLSLFCCWLLIVFHCVYQWIVSCLYVMIYDLQEGLLPVNDQRRYEPLVVYPAPLHRCWFHFQHLVFMYIESQISSGAYYTLVNKGDCFRYTSNSCCSYGKRYGIWSDRLSASGIKIIHAVKQHWDCSREQLEKRGENLHQIHSYQVHVENCDN